LKNRLVEALRNKNTVTLFLLITAAFFYWCRYRRANDRQSAQASIAMAVTTVCFPWAIKQNNEKENSNLNSNRVEWTLSTQALQTQGADKGFSCKNLMGINHQE
jgi:hypothetical protein